jgi:hypothetical protein
MTILDLRVRRPRSKRERELAAWATRSGGMKMEAMRQRLQRRADMSVPEASEPETRWCPICTMNVTLAEGTLCLGCEPFPLLDHPPEIGGFTTTGPPRWWTT